MTKQYYCRRCGKVHAFDRPQQARPISRFDITWREVGEILVGTAVWSLCLLAIFFLVAVAAVAR